jgi:predicted phage terminase large subunit-like protein
MTKAANMIGTKAIDKAERSELIDIYDHCVNMGDEWIRRQVLYNNRIDILAEYVLGYTIKPFHLAMLRWQFIHSDNLQLVFRGAGKSTMCTVTKSIHALLKCPNIKILIASKTSTNAEVFLREISAHFEGNEKLTRIFGPYYDRNLVNRWNSKEIEVLPRTIRDKEASISTIGVEGMAVGRHFNMIISDDLVDEENSRIETQRDKIKVWNYKVLEPTLDPPEEGIPHSGEHHRQGTRYHFEDLWGHFYANELKHSTQIIPCVDENGRSPWPERFPPDFFAKRRRNAGIIIFNSQYMCDTEAMKGEIFQYDQCHLISEEEIHFDNLKIFMGVDLAISEKTSSDKFAIVVVGRDLSKNYYVLDFYENNIRFVEQTRKIIEYYLKWRPVRCGIEINAYQDAQYQNLRDTITEEKDGIDGKDLRLTRINTDKDKITRAWKLSSLFDDGRMFFKDTQRMSLLIEHLVLFPSYKFKDLFDALDLAIRASRLVRRRKRRKEPGII